MTLKLLDYKGIENYFDIGELDSIEVIYIEIISGDEVARVIYKDGTEKQFDSGNHRMIDYLDGGYEVYNAGDGFDILEKEDFKNREDSYDYFDKRNWA